MKSEAGIWVDHSKAVIVTLTGGELAAKEILSNRDKHGRFSTGSSEDGHSEDMQDRQYDNQLNVFYDEVIREISDVDVVLIMGPGEAKGELVKRLERDKSGSRIVSLETADKMTGPQIAEKVRQHFPTHKNTQPRR
jgi:stalled ribosome rescue protein Dom34